MPKETIKLPPVITMDQITAALKTFPESESIVRKMVDLQELAWLGAIHAELLGIRTELAYQRQYLMMEARDNSGTIKLREDKQ